MWVVKRSIRNLCDSVTGFFSSGDHMPCPCQKLNNSSLADSLANSGSPLQKREKLYLLAVGYYRSGEYRRSRQLAEQCLEMVLLELASLQQL
ncbi:Mitochondrial fission 1 protein A [Camellia lanceoleosa]|uniref:Mitochondrial fission 1 protein A n=1 Tax=Camellia lanceoleosa TaxID=1840588 RepID=A0ACC0GCH0_9ERIC|nr:Mitochondrial fission 1 protein A [Camellia lanceoleosa]